MCLTIILKVTKNESFTSSLENTVLELRIRKSNSLFQHILYQNYQRITSMNTNNDIYTRYLKR